MIIGTLNIREGGSLVKRKRVSSIISKGKADIFFIQESKLKKVNEDMAMSFWRSGEIDSSSSESIGLSGGLIILWKSNLVSVEYSFRGEGFWGIKDQIDNCL